MRHHAGNTSAAQAVVEVVMSAQRPVAQPVWRGLPEPQHLRGRGRQWYRAEHGWGPHLAQRLARRYSPLENRPRPHHALYQHLTQLPGPLAHALLLHPARCDHGAG
jgi:hypothetical protein